MEYRYKPTGVCAKEIVLQIEEGIIKDLKVVGGCDGNHKGISALAKGMKIDEAKERLRGIKCGLRQTSCPDQIASAIDAYLKSQAL